MRDCDNGIYCDLIICVAGSAACRYEKGSWSGCVNQLMARIDSLKANSDATCEKTRRLTKRCKPETNVKKTKGKSFFIKFNTRHQYKNQLKKNYYHEN